jgi:predicted transcriptional regulator YheO
VILINAVLKKYMPLVDFLAEILGSEAEVVLHDVSDLQKSVIAIRNGHISGRKIGAPATNFALSVMKNASYSKRDFTTNYRGKSENGKTLKSSTYFIRDDNGKLIGMLCVNIDFEKFIQLRDSIDRFISLPNSDDENEIECFSSSVEKVAYECIDNIIKKSGVSPERMSQDEKIEIIKQLNDRGIFLLKGSISEVALQLKVSEATIYRYLNKVKKED